MGTIEPALVVTISPHKMPRRTRNGLLISLGGALLAAIAALTWVVPPEDLVSTVIWAVAVGAASLLVGLYMAGFVVPTTLRVDAESIHARQWRFEKELAFSEVERLYLFHEGNHEKLAVVPARGAVWFLGLGLSQEELGDLVSRLDAIARERGIAFQRGLTFPEVYEQEARRTSGPRR